MATTVASFSLKHPVTRRTSMKSGVRNLFISGVLKPVLRLWPGSTGSVVYLSEYAFTLAVEVTFDPRKS